MDPRHFACDLQRVYSFRELENRIVNSKHFPMRVQMKMMVDSFLTRLQFLYLAQLFCFFNSQHRLPCGWDGNHLLETMDMDLVLGKCSVVHIWLCAIGHF